MVQSPDDPGHEIPVAFKVGHELRLSETDLSLSDLGFHLRDVVDFNGRKVFYSWIGGTRIQWRGQGHYRALTPSGTAYLTLMRSNLRKLERANYCS